MDKGCGKNVWSGSSDIDPTVRLRQLFSGVPAPKRDIWPIAMLQAFIDDSKTGEEVLVLAGYVGYWRRWEQFSIEWQGLLDEYPPWDEFKMARAARHPERAQRFYQVAKDHVATYLASVVEIGALRRLCDELALPPFCRNPYNFAIKAILAATYGELGRVGLEYPIEFIFDDRGEKVHIRHGWDWFVLGMSPEARAIIKGEPKFESSMHVKPLQSAEIIAWHAREHWLRHRSFDSPIEYVWPESDPIRGQLVHWDYAALKPNMESFRRLLTDIGFPLSPLPT